MIDPPLTALRSFVADQQGMVKTLDVDDFRCHNKEHAKAIARLVERSQTVMPDVNDSRIWIWMEDIEDEMGAEGWDGWPDIRRAAERLSAAFGKEIRLVCDRKLMVTGAGRREDLKAIWDKVFSWSVDSDVGYLVFFKDEEGGGRS